LDKKMKLDGTIEEQTESLRDFFDLKSGQTLADIDVPDKDEKNE
jgi:hypothetical protein